MIDLTNKKYGRLTVIEKAERPCYWKCRCECGTEKEVRGDHLRYGNIVSCGCLNKENTSILGKKMSHKIAGANRFDITGNRFGRLTALKLVQSGDKTHSEIWLCKCQCGALQMVNKANLLSNHTRSCGCIMSKLEKEVGNILKKNNIPFTKNKTFDSCRLKNGNLAKFDFFVNEKYIIECDGIQHDKVAGGSIYTKESYMKIKENDRLKEDWCRNNGIEIIRIPYSRLGKLKLEDVMPIGATAW